MVNKESTEKSNSPKNVRFKQLDELKQSASEATLKTVNGVKGVVGVDYIGDEGEDTEDGNMGYMSKLKEKNCNELKNKIRTLEPSIQRYNNMVSAEEEVDMLIANTTNIFDRINRTKDFPQQKETSGVLQQLLDMYPAMRKTWFLSREDVDTSLTFKNLGESLTKCDDALQPENQPTEEVKLSSAQEIQAQAKAALQHK